MEIDEKIDNGDINYNTEDKEETAGTHMQERSVENVT